jgi:hypothetical protein
MWDSSFSQQCCWRFRPWGMWCCGVGWVVPMLRRTSWTARLLKLTALSSTEMSANLCSDIASNSEDLNRHCSDSHSSAVFTYVGLPDGHWWSNSFWWWEEEFRQPLSLTGRHNQFECQNVAPCVTCFKNMSEQNTEMQIMGIWNSIMTNVFPAYFQILSNISTVYFSLSYDRGKYFSSLLCIMETLRMTQQSECTELKLLSEFHYVCFWHLLLKYSLAFAEVVYILSKISK